MNSSRGYGTERGFLRLQFDDPVIPFLYRLRPEVHIRRAGDRWQVWSSAPMNALWINSSFASLLTDCNGATSIGDLGLRYRIPEESVLTLCEYFRRRGMLQIEPHAQTTDFAPAVTVIIPVYEREEDLEDCLRGLDRQTYPDERLEVLVVDDGSLRPPERVCSRHRCTLVASTPNHGQSFCRNLGAGVASGEVLAFLDSDCVPDPDWLTDLVPYLSWERVGAVGGFVDGFYAGSALDRYEAALSSLNMGRHTLMAADDTTTFYVPTCNLLVRKDVYLSLRGVREELRVGEDVDFCWRLRSLGHMLVYTPAGRVRHKHRNALGSMLRRKAQYGSSEAMLYGLHPKKKKTFPTPGLPWATWLLLTVGAASLSPVPAAAATVPVAVDSYRRHSRMKRAGIPNPARDLALSLARTHLSAGYFISSHVTRYYLLALLLLGAGAPGAAFLALWCLAWSSGVEYAVRRPRLSFPVFLALFALDNASYQLGVAVGCLKRRSFSSYIPVFRPPLS